MAESTIKRIKEPIIQTQFDTSYKANVLIYDKSVLIFGTVHSGTDGISQYQAVLYQVLQGYRPSTTRRFLGAGNDANQYKFQMLTAGTLQALEAIPANVDITLVCTWDY